MAGSDCPPRTGAQIPHPCLPWVPLAGPFANRRGAQALRARSRAPVAGFSPAGTRLEAGHPPSPAGQAAVPWAERSPKLR